MDIDIIHLLERLGLSNFKNLWDNCVNLEVEERCEQYKETSNMSRPVRGEIDICQKLYNKDHRVVGSPPTLSRSIET